MRTPLRITTRVLLAVTTLFATIGMLAVPASAAVVAQGTNPTTPSNTPVTGTVTFTADAGEAIYWYNQAGSTTNGGNVAYDTVTGGDVSPLTFHYTYTPPANFSGTDTDEFRVLVCEAPDFSVCRDQTYVETFTVTNQPLVVTGDGTGNYTTPVNTQIWFTGSVVDPEGGTATLQSYVYPTHGDWGGNFIGTGGYDFYYQPHADYVGSDVIVFDYVDSAGNVTTITFNINVAVPNVAPVANPDSYTVEQGNTLTVNAPGVLTNDTDANTTDTLTAVDVGSPTNGLIEAFEDGSFTYTPAPNFVGTDTFGYSVWDGQQLSDATTVTITVTATAPVAVDESVITDEDTVLNGNITATDANGDTLNYSILTPPEHAGFLLNFETGAFTYTPETNWNGTDSFEIEVCDREEGHVDRLCDTATINVTVSSVNDTPVASDGTVTTTESTPVTGTIVVADVDNSTFAFNVDTNPANGTVTVDATTGVYTYTPNTNFVGADSFVINACDSENVDALCDTATIAVTVTAAPVTPVDPTPTNDAPSTSDFTLNTTENTVVNGTLSVFDDDDTTHTYTVETDATNGEVDLNATNGMFTYTPNTGFVGTDTFVIEVCDDSGACDTATITVNVSADEEPPAENSAPRVAPGESLAGPDQTVNLGDTVVVTGGNVLDADGDVLTYTWTQLEGVGPMLTVTGANTPQASFTPQFPGVYVFEYVVCDPSRECVTDTVTITVLEAGAANPVTPIAPVAPVTPVVPVAPVVPVDTAPVATQKDTLAETGSNTTQFAGIGLMMLLAGGVALILGRRKES